MEDVRAQRSEPLQFFVAAPPAHGLHAGAGDKAHRFCVRSGDPLLISFGVHTSIRPIVSCLAVGRSALCFVQDIDDVEHAARRLHASAPGHLADLPVALWHKDLWTASTLSALAA